MMLERNGGANSTPQKQWQAQSGAHSLKQRVLEDLRREIERLEALPEDVYERAPGTYIGLLLEHFRTITQTVEWGQRCLVDEAVETKSLSMRKTAKSSGVAYSTVQRWAERPLLVIGSTFGPGTIPDGRGRRRANGKQADQEREPDKA